MVSSLFASGTGIVAATGISMSDLESAGDHWYGAFVIFVILVISPLGAVAFGLLTGFKSRGAVASGMLIGPIVAMLLFPNIAGIVMTKADVGTLESHYSISDIRFSYTDGSSDGGTTFSKNVGSSTETASIVTFTGRDGKRHSGTVKLESDRIILYDGNALGPSGSTVEYGTGSAKGGSSKTAKPKPKPKKPGTSSKARKGTFRGTEPKTYDYTDEPVKGARGAA